MIITIRNYAKSFTRGKKLKEKQNDCWHHILLDLKKNNIEILSYNQLIKLEKKLVKKLFY